MEKNKPVLEKADKIAIAVMVAAFLTFSCFLCRSSNKEQAQQTKQEQVKTASSKAMQVKAFNIQNQR